MATILMLMLRKENIEHKQQMWGFFYPIVLVCMICTGMCTSGVRIFGMRVIMERLLMVVLGKLEVIVVKDCSVAVAG